MNEKTFYIHISDGTVETRQIELQFDEKSTLDDIQKAVEKLGRSVCAYCGNEEDQADSMAILNHILTCEKRPEKKLLEKAFEIEDALYTKIIHLTDSPYDPETCDLCREIREILEIYNSKDEEDELQKPDAQVS